jgi:hypothetical protein
MNMNAGSFSKETSTMEANADLKDGGKLTHGHGSHSGRQKENCQSGLSSEENEVTLPGKSAGIWPKNDPEITVPNLKPQIFIKFFKV